MAAKKSILVATFLLFCAFSFTPIRARHVTDHEKGERIAEIRRLSSNDDFVPVLSPQRNDQPYYNHFALWHTLSGNWHGVRANISVWSIPNVQPDSFSASVIGAVNGKEGIAAGLHVYPDLYNNNGELHFFVYTNLDSSVNSRGCYNNEKCTGFVTDKGASILPGNRVGPSSVVDGQQRYITLRINKIANGDWYLYREDQGSSTPLGYWPSTLFKNLQNNADNIQMGGVVQYLHDEVSPPMGSGHLAEDDEGKAAWFKNVAVYDKDDNNAALRYPDNITAYDDKKACYDTSLLFYNGSPETYSFYYGGPSGCKDIVS